MNLAQKIQTSLLVLTFVLLPTPTFAFDTIPTIQRVSDDLHDYNQWGTVYRSELTQAWRGLTTTLTDIGGIDFYTWSNPFSGSTTNHDIYLGDDSNGQWGCSTITSTDLRWVDDYNFNTFYVVEKAGGYSGNYPTGYIEAQFPKTMTGTTVATVTYGGTTAVIEEYTIGDYTVYKYVMDWLNDVVPVDVHPDYNNITCGFKFKYHSGGNTSTPNPIYQSWIRSIFWTDNSNVELMSEAELINFIETGTDSDGYNLPSNIIGFGLSDEYPDDSVFTLDEFNDVVADQFRGDSYLECDAQSSGFFDEALCKTMVALFTPSTGDFTTFFQQEFAQFKSVLPIGYITLLNQERRTILEGIADGSQVAGYFEYTPPSQATAIRVFDLATFSAPLSTPIAGTDKIAMDYLQTFINFAMGLLLVKYIYGVTLNVLGIKTAAQVTKEKD